MIRLDVQFERGLISDSRYQAYGCPATMAAAAWVSETILGCTILEAAALTAHEIIDGAGYSDDHLSSGETALDALHGALGAAVASGVSLRSPGSPMDPDGVLVGMSGGVDSAVAALALQRQGLRVVGITLGLWHDGTESGERACCSPDAVRRARRVAHRLGIPHLSVDAEKDFIDCVVKYFVDEYAAGLTPNPCAKCNARTRFPLMLDIAERLGLSGIATGHYARLVGPERRLARGVDRKKDQSYVVAEVDPMILHKARFPLGEWTKVKVRRMAKDARLEGYEAPESQEICFVTDDDHRRFLRDRLGERPGIIVDLEGKALAEHRGTYNYTIGQRKGLGIPASEPLYVVTLDAERRQVCVGPLEALDVKTVVIGGLTWHGSVPDGPVTIQVRSAGDAVTARLPSAEAGGIVADRAIRLSVTLEEPLRGVACGQTAVVYQDERVVCAGTIVATSHGTPPESGPIEPVGRAPVV